MSTKFTGSTGTGKQSGFKSSMTLFSSLLSPSEASPSMKLSLSNRKSCYTSELRIQAISPTLYDDPAFSPDPHVHPFFANCHDGWTSPPMVGHPTLKKDAHRLPHLAIPPDSGEFRLIQPPNSPMSADNSPTNRPPHSPSLSHQIDTAKATVAAATRSRSVPSSTLSHSTTQANNNPRSEKKRNPLAMFWRKSPPVSPADQHTDPDSKNSNEPPPSYENIFSDPPSTLPFASSEIRTQSSTDVSLLSSQSTMVSTGSQTPSGSQGPPVGKRRNRRNKLDRIDELDETNPLGIPVHHGGPYEAIQRLIQPHSRRNDPYDVRNQYPVSAGICDSKSLLTLWMIRALPVPRKAILPRYYGLD
jgi:hypothetical protein